ncbi:DNA polymerase III subunit chi [Candidimonas sp. SYP-B2681]|uniref:DNA polymerase III subunit chi n=1 Tax=Candidimonas sp. SYP-B2681 TaxID=2497686 RepID=UPI000F8947B6|nr:DNA polymerase III subunit chi [Candidimonas sp. SYP-B2681]RTZ42507.1 DNA polymerase III subunit chi [Candidimonas sp. SYP-B2681]
MARIDFAFGATDRLRMACEVVRKHYLAGRPLVIYTKDTQRLVRFDRLLWGFEATSFVPHVLADDPLAGQTAVWLTSAEPTPPAVESGQLQPWLLNLDLQCPPGAEKFERILEIVSNHDDDKQAARERWREYKEAGHALHAHDLSGKT